MDGARALSPLIAAIAGVLCAQAACGQHGPELQAPHPGSVFPDAMVDGCEGCGGVAGPDGCGAGCGQSPWSGDAPSPRHWLQRQMDLRHSASHGRAMGPGDPLRGTSWRNRPYWLSLDGGGLLMTTRPATNVRANNDLLGAIGVGWDFDHYWGSQLRVGWSTPELLSTEQPASDSDDNLFITDLSVLYYPWGDSRVRPYWRLGVGLTDVEYTNELGRRQQDMLFTFAFGAGVKQQITRSMAWRLELVDNLAFGQNETNTLNNLTISAGVEWRYGARADEYWAWTPRTGGW